MDLNNRNTIIIAIAIIIAGLYNWSKYIFLKQYKHK